LVNFFIETFGCTANISASELMSYLLLECGFEKTDKMDSADFIILNTCVVKAPTESKIKDQIIKLSNRYPLIIAGCLPQVMSDWCKENIPKAALIGVDHFYKICQAADAILNDQEFKLISRKKEFSSEAKRVRARDLTGIIEISKGCTGQCAYCIVRIAKGPLVSKSPDSILNEARTALNEGCREIWLTAQDTASYGIDIKESLPDIVKTIAALPSDFMIRIGMMNADYALQFLPEIKEMFKLPNVYSFIHLPLQSGSDNVLTKMKRKYTVKEYAYLIEELRKIKDFTISTDIITGLPGETEENFNQTKKLLEKIKFDIVNISKYGDRRGTVASKSKEKIPSEIIKERSVIITKLVSKMTLKRNEKWIGWQGDALALRIDKRNKSILLRNKFYKLISVENSPLDLGKWYRVEIEKARKTRLIGRVVSVPE